MFATGICKWVVIAFDSSIEDPRDYLQVEYGGLTLHIKPGRGDGVNLVSVFLERPDRDAEVYITVNRFLSAMAWNDGEAYVTLGSLESGALLSEKDQPRFNYSESRVLRNRIGSRFKFEHLQEPSQPRPKLALALYREGLNSVLPLYRLLSFYKIINIGFGTGAEQAAWINANLGKVRDYFGAQRLQELVGTEPDVGMYLFVKGRSAIAHAFCDPIRDPDVPDDVRTAKKDAELMEVLAQIFIQDELGVPSLKKIHHEHLYELAGFKRLFGEPLSARLEAGENIPVTDFPAIPSLTIGLNVGLRHGLRYDCLTTLPFKITSCVGGVVVLETDETIQPIRACLLLAFPAERLEFALERFGISGKHPAFGKAVQICWYRFLIDYFCNGYLQIFNSTTNERLSHKSAFLPQDIDLGATIDGWRKKIAELEA